MPPGTATRRPSGLADLRRSGAVTELLFLYECVTEAPTQLRPIAQRLGLTVQAASHQFRKLARRGLAELKDGRYRSTVAGVAWLHGALGPLRDDVRARLDRLNVVRSCRAIAATDLAAGAPVRLELADGRLVARPGAGGASRGRARTAAARGSLVEVDRLEGIVPIRPATVRVLVIPEARLGEPGLAASLRRTLGRPSSGLLAAPGLEAAHLVGRVTDRPTLRFGVASASREAARVGVPSTVVVLDAELPRLLAEFEGHDPPTIEIATISRREGRERRPERG